MFTRGKQALCLCKVNQFPAVQAVVTMEWISKLINRETYRAKPGRLGERCSSDLRPHMHMLFMDTVFLRHKPFGQHPLNSSKLGTEQTQTELNSVSPQNLCMLFLYPNLCEARAKRKSTTTNKMMKHINTSTAFISHLSMITYHSIWY